ncbi:unnamed protein product [Bursaphelenchus xylophilus]|uniref:Oligomycin sensitivity conferral protein n=1 Tax=Bursaphelenchus xylophilus TaxID=6326 RepID=A0A1I7SEA3_BURXY|nr:unnamed protein product [Bursaphelenchus xylophilus]CAG9087381.1 unnamed protein product [Bursaphelenchus xylophilus]
MIKRAFATSASVAAQAVRVPIQTYGIEGKYASSLYTAAHKKNVLDAVDKDLQKVKDLYATSKDFKTFVQNPTLKRNQKKAAVEAVLKKVGVSSEVQNFCGVLAENGRLANLQAVINSFETIMRAYRGELAVDVVSAEKLNSSQEAALKDALSKHVKAGQKLTINFQVKPSIIGGLVVTIGDRYVDLSVASKIKKLSDVVKTTL